MSLETLHDRIETERDEDRECDVDQDGRQRTERHTENERGEAAQDEGEPQPEGAIQGRQNGVLISMEQGEAVPYALNALEDRGILFVSPGEKLYEGMIIGENAKPQDLEVNPLKSKQLTNFRSTGKDEAVRLTPPRKMTLEQAIAYIQDDELVEVTPKSIRLRKRYLAPHERKKASRAAA